MDFTNIDLRATATFGLEAIVSRELKWLGYDEQRIENGSVSFKGDLEAILKTNLWLRTANRVFLDMGKFEAKSFDELFEKTKALPWEKILTKDAFFPVDGKSVKSKLFSVSDCQAIVKKAIVERLKLTHDLEIFPETGARYRIEVGLLNDIATLSIDTSGHSLHMRGYREDGGIAPIKETLAAGLLYISRWKPDRALIDPMCGSGTIPIEAAMIGMNIPPGLKQSFDFEKWPFIDIKAWEDMKASAKGQIKHDADLRIYGSDNNYFQIKLAKDHAEKAGVDKEVSFQKIDFRETSSRYQYGFIITNPPYGERLTPKIERLYMDMGKHFKSFETWSYYLITPHKELERLFNRKANRKRKLYNGNIQCDYYQFYGPKPNFKS